MRVAAAAVAGRCDGRRRAKVGVCLRGRRRALDIHVVRNRPSSSVSYVGIWTLVHNRDLEKYEKRRKRPLNLIGHRIFPAVLLGCTGLENSFSTYLV